MAFIGDTGQGTTVDLSITGAIGVCYRSIQLPTWVQEKIDASCLSTIGFMRYIPADVTDPGELTLEAIFDPTDDLPVFGQVEDITITLPVGTAGNTAATITGSGFITSDQLPSLALNELMMLTLTFAFDGDTGPLFTPEVTP